MKIKYKILLIMLFLVTLLFGSGITYSIFYSESDLVTTDQKIAKFVFESKKLDHIELPLANLNPGDVEEYNFEVNNNLSENISDVTLNYQIIIKTYHFIPLTIQLYKTDDIETLIMNCNETYTRTEKNELVCNSPIEEMNLSIKSNDKYKLKITFPSSYNTEEYSNLVDYIDLEINSWQKK